MHHKGRIVPSDAVNWRWEVGQEGSRNLRDCQSWGELGTGWRVARVPRPDRGFHSTSHNFGKLRRKRVPSEEKGGARDPTDHSTSRARTPESQSRSSPVTGGHGTIWGDAQLRAQSCPQTRGPKLPCAGTGQNTGVPAAGPAPTPRAGGD